MTAAAWARAMAADVCIGKSLVMFGPPVWPQLSALGQRDGMSRGSMTERLGIFDRDLGDGGHAAVNQGEGRPVEAALDDVGQRSRSCQVNPVVACYPPAICSDFPVQFLDNCFEDPRVSRYPNQPAL